MEEDNEWETIQQPSTSATQSDEDDVVLVTTPTPTPTPTSNFSLQPPQDDVVVVTNHHLQEEPEPVPALPSSPSSYSSSSPHSEFPQPQPQPPEVRDTNTILKAGFGVLSSWGLRIAYGIRTRIGFWSIAAAFVAVVAYGRRRQRWRRLAEKESRDQLAILVKQKDEKIKQLLLKINQMNEALSAQRRVPVLRVVVDSPLMIGPRANWKPT